MDSINVSDATLRMLKELMAAENASAQTVVDHALDYYRKSTFLASHPTAPDGLSWPKRYFDCPPKVTFEEALAQFGLRPSEYLKGWPVYTTDEMRRPEYRSNLRAEPPELQAEWDADWAATKAGKLAEVTP